MSKKLVLNQKQNVIASLFGRKKAVIGMLHCLPLPGSARYDGQSMEEIIEFSCNEARILVDGGVDGLIVENHGDIPFAKPGDIGPETVAAMTIVTAAVKRAVPCPVGINVLANGAIQALAIAKAASASFIRVNQWANAYIANEGFVEGPAAQATRYRSWLHARDIKIFADVHVKHGAHAITADRSIPELARDVEFFDADAAVATGQRTGDSASLDELEAIGSGTSLPVVVGSGVTPGNVADMFTIADAVIVASYLKKDGLWWNDVDAGRLSEFMNAANRARS
ncbi:BtpA/SgcQ family protein [Paraburkholderia xenovorans]|uniref:BtpA/SgcQ family protein n=1 Tax=Paraburkholderia xenovorans TaxID=36873 RepID=UPI0038BB1E75